MYVKRFGSNPMYSTAVCMEQLIRTNVGHYKATEYLEPDDTWRTYQHIFIAGTMNLGINAIRPQHALCTGSICAVQCSSVVDMLIVPTRRLFLSELSTIIE